ncbi:MAG: hypothetical protein RLZZ292_1342 [Bacteroidota bacterium]|jgi:hypothetical protein
MQSTTLLDNLNSDLLAAFSALLPRNSAHRVLVYVESDEDISFWRNILLPFGTYGIDFDIQLPIKNALEKGKAHALGKSEDMLNISVGTHLIICVDSDYDYLLQDTTEYSRKINNSDFIFQTYTYSIENLLCYSESLHALCVHATKNDKKVIELEELMKLYSKIIHKLFLWSVHFSRQQDTTSFTISNFCDTIKILDNVDIAEQFSTALKGLKDRVDAKIIELEDSFPSEKSHVEVLSETMKSFGLNEENTYLYAQGHTIKDNVIMMFLNPIVTHLRKEKENQIKANAQHNTELTAQLNHYKKQTISISTAINANTEFKSCFLYSKIQNDLNSYIEKFKNSLTTHELNAS